LTSLNSSNDDPRLRLPDQIATRDAAEELKAGHLVAFPTETVYGLGADATNDRAVTSIYEAKGRPTFNPLIVHVADISIAKKYAVFNDMAERFAAKFWPGALTLVLPRIVGCPLSLLVSAGLDSVAIRVPDHPIAKDLLHASHLPIAAPSANRSGDVSPTQAGHVLSSWPDADQTGPAMVLDGGSCSVGLESTVVDATTASTVILRPGGISEEQLREIAGDISYADGTPDRPRSPGMLARHYAPGCPVYLNAGKEKPGGVLLGFGGDVPGATLNLSVAGDLGEAAANLFAMLRHLDTGHQTSISVSPIPEHGLGRAINDRLRRAATPES
jgi:L-threonylcarbamoyladenylate synthase